MVMHHIGLTYDLEQSIKLYSIDNKISFSEAVRRLLSVGLNRNLNIMNYDLLDKKINTIISKQKYILLKLLEGKKFIQLKKDDCHGALKYCSYPFKKIYLFFFQAWVRIWPPTNKL